MQSIRRLFLPGRLCSEKVAGVKNSVDLLFFSRNFLAAASINPTGGKRCYSRKGFEDEIDDEDGFWERSPDLKHLKHRHPSFGSRQDFGQNTSRQKNFHRKTPNFQRHSRNHDFDDPFEREFSDDEPFFRKSDSRSDPVRFRSHEELGSRIKKKDWTASKLSPIEKNFYVEHPSLAQRSEAEIEAFYKDHGITVTRGDRPVPISDFHEANFPEEINKQLERNSWPRPTPIQSLGWPLALSGKNMVGIAQTGSGKTLGFLLPALVHIRHQRQVTRGEAPTVLILAPTRELAQQIKSVAVQYGRLLGVRSCCIFGGQSKLVQARHISEGPEIVVATPGRLLDFLEMEVISLDRTSYVVLDEADRMLDMGFEPQIRKVLEQIRPDRQILMWSATWPKEIQQLARDFLGDFTQVNIGSVELMANPNIRQNIHVCDRGEKFGLLVRELEQASAEEPQKTLIFAQTKFEADVITRRLRKLRYRALAIHGDKSQLVRDKTLHSFRNGETEILVATDVASRGLDVDDIKLVINYDYPNTADDYIHRIGRTARATKSGTAVTLITAEDAGKVEDLIKVLEDAKQRIPEELKDLRRLQAKFSSKGFSRRNSW